MAKISLWVKPGAKANGVAWDPWRKRWSVSCRAAPTGGGANRSVAELVAGWLDVPPASVRWERAGTSRAKLLVVDGLNDAEVEARLRLAVVRSAAKLPATGTP